MARTVSHTGACTWLVERLNPAFESPDWYPDSPSDVHVVVDCGAPARYYTDGSFECDAGHEHGTLEEELGPFGNEWAREQEERWA